MSSDSGVFIVGLLVFWGTILGAAYVSISRKNRKKLAAMTPAERHAHDWAKGEHELAAMWGTKNVHIVCPHCQTRGSVYVQGVTHKKGISGGKATGALLTGGLSLLATGLSRKESLTQAHCSNCSSTWVF